jgi:hypothetical protein
MTTSRLCPDWLEGFLTLTERSEPPYTYKLWVGMSLIASALRRKCVLNWGTMSIYPNMYVVLVGPSGKCRKGTAMTPGMKFLKEMGLKVAAESITREALIRELKQSNDTQIDVKTGDMYLHASLTIYSQELTVFLGYNNQALMADLTDWYDCRDTWTYRTKNMGTDEIIGVWVNLIGATTPDLLQTTLPRDAIGGGLTSRIIFVFEHNKSKITPADFQTAEERMLQKQLLTDLEKICIMSGEFKCTEGYIEKYTNWYLAYSHGKPPFDDYRFSGYFERRPTHLRKICMILSASRTSDRIITVEDFDRALYILELTEQKMPYTFSGVGRSNTADIMHRVIATVANRKEIEFGDLLRQFYQDIDSMMLEKMVQAMVVMGSAHVDYSGGKKTIIYNQESDLAH